jgi:endonuclease G, mitochondrial
VLDPIAFELAPQDFFFNDEALDFAVVAVAPKAMRGEKELCSFGCLPLIEKQGKVLVGEWLTIIQHPNGDRKQVCVRENQLVRIDDDVLWYSTDTLGGSSGSPVFNNDWIVVALHHMGVPERRDGRIQTVDGRDWNEQQDGEEKIKWLANEGIRVSRIVSTLRVASGDHSLLKPVFEATPAEAHRATQPAPIETPNDISSTKTLNTNKTMNRVINVSLQVADDGSVKVVPGGTGASNESAVIFAEAARRPRRTEKIDVPFDATYADRQGYNPDFLGTGAKRVNLPTLTPALQAEAAQLLPPAAAGTTELKYHNLSIVMHAKRRLAIFTAANVRGNQRYLLDRQNYSDESDWREDRRIRRNHQLANSYYKGNRFDRGHLTRNEDMEWGSTRLKAMQSAIDTLHYTNIAPQHDAFNRVNLHQGDEPGNLDLGLWGQLEKHILEQAIDQDDLVAQVITGPVLEDDDPTPEGFPDIPYPVRFWKVVAALDDRGKLFATAFLLDQSAVIKKLGLKERVPIEGFKTYQTSVAEIERLTGLLFTSDANPLSKADPLSGGAAARRRRAGRRRFEESTAAAEEVPSSYLPLENLSSVVLKP